MNQQRCWILIHQLYYHHFHDFSITLIYDSDSNQLMCQIAVGEQARSTTVGTSQTNKQRYITSLSFKLFWLWFALTPCLCVEVDEDSMVMNNKRTTTYDWCVLMTFKNTLLGWFGEVSRCCDTERMILNFLDCVITSSWVFCAAPTDDWLKFTARRVLSQQLNSWLWHIHRLSAQQHTTVPVRQSSSVSGGGLPARLIGGVLRLVSQSFCSSLTHSAPALSLLLLVLL